MSVRKVYSDGILPPVGPGTMCTAEEGRTRQSEFQGTDINWIVKRYEATGASPVASREGVYADITEMPTFQAALDQVRRAEEYFATLPPDIRVVFDNNPAQLLDAWNSGEEEFKDVFERIGWLERKAEELTPPEDRDPVVKPPAVGQGSP